MGCAVLGVVWRSEKDKFSMAINVSKRCRGEPTGPDLTVDKL